MGSQKWPIRNIVAALSAVGLGPGLGQTNCWSGSRVGPECHSDMQKGRRGWRSIQSTEGLLSIKEIQNDISREAKTEMCTVNRRRTVTTSGEEKGSGQNTTVEM